MNHDRPVPDWVYTVAHVGGVLFVLCILLAVLFIFVTIICDEITDAKTVRNTRKTQSHFKTAEEVRNDWK